MTKKKKVLLGVFIPLGAIVITLTLFLSIMCHGTHIRAGVGATDGGYDSVLGDIEGITEANPRLVDIAMIGAHGSGSYNVKANATMGTVDQRSTLGKMNPLIKGMTYRLAKTQTVDVRTQISMGARYLQIKCSYYEGVWWAEHALLSVELETVVKDLLDFLANTKGEILLPLFECVYYGENGTITELADFVMSVSLNGKTLKDYIFYDSANTFNTYRGDGVRIGDLRYNDVTNNGRSSGVVLLNAPDDDLEFASVYSKENENSKYFFDEDYNAFRPWHERFNSDALLDKIRETSKKISDNKERYSSYLKVNQTQGSVTGNAADWGYFVSRWSLIDFANKHNPRVIADPDFDEWLENMPIVLCDYMNCNADNFNARLNEKIRAYNVKLVENAA